MHPDKAFEFWLDNPPKIGLEPVTFLAVCCGEWMEVRGLPVVFPGYEEFSFAVHPVLIKNRKNGRLQLLFGDFGVSEITTGYRISEDAHWDIEHTVVSLFRGLLEHDITKEVIRARLRQITGPMN